MQQKIDGNDVDSFCIVDGVSGIGISEHGAYAIKIGGVTVVRDVSKDMLFAYSDGTSEALYFNAAGTYAGKSERV